MDRSRLLRGITALTVTVAAAALLAPHAASGSPRSDGDVQSTEPLPTAEPDQYEIVQDTALVVPSAGRSKVTANDTVASGDTAVAHLSDTGLPTHGTVVSFDDDGSFTYQPAAGFVGTDSFSYYVSSTAGSSPAVEVTIVVQAGNRPPVAVPDRYSTGSGQTLSVTGVGVLANDSDPDGDALSAEIVSGPSHGALTLRRDGRLVYTPNAGWSGADSFRYRASDGASSSATVTDRIDVTTRVSAGTHVVRPTTSEPPAQVGSLTDRRARRPHARHTGPVTRQINALAEGPHRAADVPGKAVEPPVAAAAHQAAALALSEPFVLPGGAVTARGKGCPARSRVVLTVDGAAAGSGHARDDGTFEIAVSAPRLPVGNHTVIARCDGRTLTAPLSLASVTADGSAPAARVVTIAAMLAFLLLAFWLGVRPLRTRRAIAARPEADAD